MARYIDEILQPGEKVLYSTNAHWIYYLPAIVGWTVALVLVAASLAVPPMAVLGLPTATVIAAVAIYFTVKGWFHRFTTETDVTDRRVVHKTGFINRHTFEISLDKIASVEVNQSIPGRLLNYGNVSIVGMGEVPPQVIKTIASPLSFRSAITAH